MHQVHPHHHVPRLEEGLINGQVGCRSGEGLDVDGDLLYLGLFISKALRDPSPGERLQEVNVLHALVEPSIGIAAQVTELVG